MAIVVLYARYIYKLRAFTAWTKMGDGNTQIIWSNTGQECFGFNLGYIWVRIKQMFVLNYAWVLVLLLIITFFISRLRRIRINISNMEGLVGGTLGFIVFNCFYITAELARYNVLVTLVFSIICYCVIEAVVVHHKWKMKQIILWGIVAVLFVIQTFLPIDSVSNVLFRRLDTGKIHILHTGTHSDYLGEYLVYNYQYRWLDRAYDKMLQQAGYSEDMLIIIPDEQRSASHIHGNPGAYDVVWDTEKEQRVMYDSDQTIDLQAYTMSKINLMEESELLERAIIFFIPYYGIDKEEQLELLQGKYKVVEENKAIVFGGVIDYCILEKIL